MMKMHFAEMRNGDFRIACGGKIRSSLNWTIVRELVACRKCHRIAWGPYRGALPGGASAQRSYARRPPARRGRIGRRKETS